MTRLGRRRKGRVRQVDPQADPITTDVQGAGERQRSAQPRCGSARLSQAGLEIGIPAQGIEPFPRAR